MDEAEDTADVFTASFLAPLLILHAKPLLRAANGRFGVRRKGEIT